MKNKVKTYLASLISTWLVIMLIVGFFVTENNTLSVGFSKIETPLSMKTKGYSGVTISLFGNSTFISFDGINQIQKVYKTYFTVVPPQARLGAQVTQIFNDRKEDIKLLLKQLGEYIKSLDKQKSRKEMGEALNV